MLPRAVFELILTQPALQFVVGVTLAVLIRATSLLLLILVASVSRPVTQLRLSALLEELTLYKFFERRPAVLMARATELELWAAFFAIAFCILWAGATAWPFSGALAIFLAAVATLLACVVGWFLIDVFRLVYPISHFQTYETATQQRIARMKARVDISSRRLKTQQEELADLDSNLARMASIADSGAFEDVPFFEEALHQTERPPADDALQVAAKAPTTPPEPVAPLEVPLAALPVESVPLTAPQSSAPHTEESALAVRPRSDSAAQGSVYQSAWMSGRVKRWPDGASFGFITADTGEVFHAGADSLAGLEAIEEGAEVLFQPVAGTPHRRAVLVCAIRSYAQGRVNGVRGNMGFITIQDSRRSASIYFRLPVGKVPDFDIGDTVGFRFGRNILGPTAERIDPDVDGDQGAQRRQR